MTFALAWTAAGQAVDLASLTVLERTFTERMRTLGPFAVRLIFCDAGSRLGATMSSFFWIGAVMSLVALRFVDRFGEDEVRLTRVMLPGVLLGLLVSRWTSAVVDRGYTRSAVLTVAAAVGLAVIVRHLVS